MSILLNVKESSWPLEDADQISAPLTMPLCSCHRLAFQPFPALPGGFKVSETANPAFYWHGWVVPPEQKPSMRTQACVIPAAAHSLERQLPRTVQQLPLLCIHHCSGAAFFFFLLIIQLLLFSLCIQQLSNKLFSLKWRWNKIITTWCLDQVTVFWGS